MTPRHNDRFGQRLARLRKAVGLTQQQLADEIGVSRRVVGYYEAESLDTPPGSLLAAIAKALNVSADQLLGIQAVKNQDRPHGNSALMRRLKQIQQLPPADQKAVFKVIDALVSQKKHAG